MALNPIGWFEIYVQDMERARAFYEGVLQIKLEKLDGVDLAMLSFPSNQEAYGCSGALVHHADMPSGGNSTLVYFNCDDCADAATRVEGSGGTLQREKMSIGQYGFVALARDPDGNMIGLHSTK